LLPTSLRYGPHHQRHWSRDDRLAWRVDALLRHAEKSISACESRRRETGRESHTRLPRTPPTLPATAPAHATRDDALSYARFLFRLNKQLSFHSIPKPLAAMHDESLPDDFYKEAKFCSMCGPKFCSMNITQLAEAESGSRPGRTQAKIRRPLSKGARSVAVAVDLTCSAPKF